MLPRLDGYQVCTRMRADGNWTPILMLTARGGEHDEAQALDTGADDYLSKPFSYVVLLAGRRARRGRPWTPARTTTSQALLVTCCWPTSGRWSAEAPASARRSSRSATLEIGPATRARATAGRAVDLTSREFAGQSVPGPPQRRGRVKRATPRARVGLRLRGRPQCRRGSHLPPPRQDRPAVLHAKHPHGPGGRLPVGTRCPVTGPRADARCASRCPITAAGVRRRRTCRQRDSPARRAAEASNAVSRTRLCSGPGRGGPGPKRSADAVAVLSR